MSQSAKLWRAIMGQNEKLVDYFLEEQEGVCLCRSFYCMKNTVKLLNRSSDYLGLGIESGNQVKPWRTLSSVENHQHSTVYCDDCASEYREKRDSLTQIATRLRQISRCIHIVWSNGGNVNVNGRKRRDRSNDLTRVHHLYMFFFFFFTSNIFTHRETAFFF